MLRIRIRAKARIIHWQFGTRIPVVRFLGLHTRALYAHLGDVCVYVSADQMAAFGFRNGMVGRLEVGFYVFLF